MRRRVCAFYTRCLKAPAAKTVAVFSTVLAVWFALREKPSQWRCQAPTTCLKQHCNLTKNSRRDTATPTAPNCCLPFADSATRRTWKEGLDMALPRTSVRRQREALTTLSAPCPHASPIVVRGWYYHAVEEQRAALRRRAAFAHGAATRRQTRPSRYRRRRLVLTTRLAPLDRLGVISTAT